MQFELLSAEEVGVALRNLDEREGSGCDNLPPFVIKSSANVLAVPLSNVSNTSFITGVFPSALEHALVVLIAKLSDPKDFGDWRPISILPVFAKVLEKLAYRQIYNHMAKHRLLSKKQHGFLRESSTESLLLGSLDEWRAVNSGEYVILVFLDFVMRLMLLLVKKLNAVGFHGSDLGGLISYLSDRKQQIVWCGNDPCLIQFDRACLKAVFSGPKFLLFINSLLEISTNGAVKCYAEDTSLYGAGKDLSNLVILVNVD